MIVQTYPCTKPPVSHMISNGLGRRHGGGEFSGLNHSSASLLYAFDEFVVQPCVILYSVMNALQKYMMYYIELMGLLPEV